MAGLGRLLSPLPLSELTLSMIRKLKESYTLNQQVEDAMGKSQFGRFFAPFEKELIRMEKVAEQTKVAIVRMQGSLKSVEANLNSYRRKLKKISKKDPSAKDQMKYVESMLTQVRKLKDNIRDESRRAIREESWIFHNV